MMEYKDLSDSAKERAYKNFQDLSDSAEEDILTETRDMLETKGIYEPVFSYSGYSAQSDGACFTGNINLKDFLDTHESVRTAHPELYIAIIPFDGKEPACRYFDINLTRRSSRYSHENAVHLGTWDYEYLGSGGTDAIDGYYEKLIVDAEKDIEETCRDYMRELYRRLEAEDTYRSSMDAFLEECHFHKYTIAGDLA